jgi:hypothetical protein
MTDPIRLRRNAFRWVAVVATLLGTPGAPLGAQQIDTIRVGSPALESSALLPGTYVIENYRRTDGTEILASITTQTITPSRVGGIEVFVVAMTHAPTNGDTTVSRTQVRASDLALQHHRTKGTRDSAAVSATDGVVTGWVVLPETPTSLIDEAIAQPVFPIEGQIPWIFPLLPLAEGYAAAIPHFSEWAGGEKWSTIRVTGSERLTIGGAEIECWIVDGGELFRGYNVTYWVSKASRRIVQGVAKGAGSGPEFWSRMRAP